MDKKKNPYFWLTIGTMGTSSHRWYVLKTSQNIESV